MFKQCTQVDLRSEHSKCCKSTLVTHYWFSERQEKDEIHILQDWQLQLN